MALTASRPNRVSGSTDAGDQRAARRGRSDADPRLQLLFEPVGLAAQLARLARPFPRAPPPFALAEPGGDAADDEAESKRAEQEQEQRRLQRKRRLASAERIENEGCGFSIDDGKRDQRKAKGKHNKGEDELTPHCSGPS